MNPIRNPVPASASSPSPPTPPPPPPHHQTAHVPSCQNLHLLMPLARKQNNVSRPRRTNRNRNRPRPVLLHNALRRRLPHPRQSLFNDRHRLFAPRIVLRQHHQIASFTRGPPHLRPLRPISIATAPKQRNHPPATAPHQLSRQRHQIPQRIIGVRIVHHHREASLARTRHHLKPPRHLPQRRRTRSNLLQRKPASQRRTRRRQQVLHIHPPRQRRCASPPSPCGVSI